MVMALFKTKDVLIILFTFNNDGNLIKYKGVQKGKVQTFTNSTC